ncbi:MAG: amidohydrolase [Clostridiaceae bacterium]|nr:amidohydrolase [Eubacteriales bacterium]
MLLIRNGYIAPMSGRDYERGSVLVDAGKIAAVGESVDLEMAREAQVLDASGLIVMPGLIDAHSHIGILEDKKGAMGDDCNETANPLSPTLRAIDAINPMDSAFHNALASGITSAMVGPGSSNIVGGQFAFIKLTGRSIDRMTVLFPAAMKVAFGENPKTTYGDNGNMPSTRMSIASMLREELFLAQGYKKKRDDALKSGEGFEPDFRMESYMPLFEGKIPLKAHVHRADDILTAIRIAKEFSLSATLDHCTEGHLVTQEIAASGFPAIVGPSLASRSKPEVESLDFKTAGILHKAGVLVAITTDHPVTRIQYLALCAGLAAREGLGEYEALKAITINAARICRVSHRVGSLEPEKDADIAIFDGNPLDVFASAVYTIVDGEIVYQKK